MNNKVCIAVFGFTPSSLGLASLRPHQIGAEGPLGPSPNVLFCPSMCGMMGGIVYFAIAGTANYTSVICGKNHIDGVICGQLFFDFFSN